MSDAYPVSTAASAATCSHHRHWWRAAALCLLLALAASAFAGVRDDGNPIEKTDAREAVTRQLQHVLDQVKARLGIDRAVTVVLVARNPYLVSVEAPDTLGDAFAVRVEEAMLALLSEDEVEAALAHELGHVWVFTHHPYLQTEQLANQVAMRAVSRDALARVYEKVWKRDGTKGDLVSFLGQ